jgi:hypothetical protein
LGGFTHRIRDLGLNGEFETWVLTGVKLEPLKGYPGV